MLVNKGFMKNTAQPILFYCDLPPRKSTIDEQEAIISWLMENRQLDHSSASGLLEASLVAVFDPNERFMPRMTEKRIVVINGGVLVFDERSDGEIELKQVYKSI